MKNPSPSEMESFASKYTAEQWEKLIKSKEFLGIFAEDLTQAALIAIKILKQTS